MVEKSELSINES